MSLVGRALCTLGFHNLRWKVTATTPQFNWRECTRCGHVDEQFRDHYRAYHRLTGDDPDA